MRLTLWQQFSSNHSGDFAVVGRFASQEDAESVAKQLRHILQTVQAWCALPENKKWINSHEELRRGSRQPITPPETAFAKEYSIDWGEFGIDWVTSEADVDEAVNIVERDVFVTTVQATWSRPTPIENLMAGFGGDVKREIWWDSPALFVHLKCSAPNEEIADEIFDAAQKHLEAI